MVGLAVGMGLAGTQEAIHRNEPRIVLMVAPQVTSESGVQSQVPNLREPSFLARPANPGSTAGDRWRSRPCATGWGRLVGDESGRPGSADGS
jgi:hypothetical protein